MKYLIIILTLYSSACSNNQQVKPNEPKRLLRIIADTTNNNAAQDDFDIYKIKKELCKRLCLYDLENGTDSFELRLWQEPSMWEPHGLYILKGIDTSWTIYRYLFYQRHNNYETDDYKVWDAYRNPRIDSIKVETLYPRKMSWSKYLINLQFDSIWNYRSQSEIKGKFGALDGESYSLEIANKTKYKFIHYNNPEADTLEINHKKFIAFMDKLIGPLLYNGIINP